MSSPVRISVLHLEDSANDAELVQAMLDMSNIIYSVERVEDHDGYMDAITGRCHDLILADYSLPSFDGLQALDLARKHCPDTPFVFVSGALGEDLAIETLRRGATDYVLKHKLYDLETVVKRALENSVARVEKKRADTEVRRAKDEAESASAAKSQFLSRMSHELRTPLNAIMGYTQYMQADPLTEEQQHCTGQILKASQHLLKLINEVLDVSRIEAGQIALSIKPVHSVEIISQSIDLVKPLAQEAGIQLHSDSGPCNQYLMADEDRTIQILVNLLSNAIKYNKPGGHVFVECHLTDVAILSIQVRDTGIGIPEDKLSRLFTPFDRLGAERNTEVPGTGLGLAISKGLVEAMSGTMGVESSSDSGTIFWFELPVSDHGPEVEAPPNESDALAVALPDTCRILLIDDNLAHVDFMQRVFKRRPRLSVTSVMDGESGLLAASQSVPDIILLDLNLPDISGADVLKALKNDGRLKDVPVIIVTADASPDHATKLLELGATAYLTKPLDIPKLILAIHTACARTVLYPGD